RSLSMSKAWIALGGNLGQVLQAFRHVRLALQTMPSCQLLASSLLYQTPPIGPEGQGDYLNAVLHIQTSFIPIELLNCLQALEQRHGRIRHEHWGARTLDLDIIAYDDVSMDSERLILPHQHMHWRQFVLRPMCDISPDWLHPIQQVTAQTLLKKILATGEAALPDGKKW
ncbi:MAG: 2-amino-4-hydroxy-6-hydroxymethyldihydropteridine diphosphokinase, partial [Mariprofundaceae bacterium]|nr:2-amino-4-hydroxy-6-hydroxymethyldihydropteridine diphosphokinase [Mariprofundaceae bacterium]